MATIIGIWLLALLESPNTLTITTITINRMFTSCLSICWFSSRYSYYYCAASCYSFLTIPSSVNGWTIAYSLPFKDSACATISTSIFSAFFITIVVIVIVIVTIVIRNAVTAPVTSVSFWTYSTLYREGFVKFTPCSITAGIRITKINISTTGWACFIRWTGTLVCIIIIAASSSSTARAVSTIINIITTGWACFTRWTGALEC